ncbi:protein D3-like [Ctenocephalides felis]|uniref:protein D3-like n=1 Tax=Ctenocephalides felis TaxID=7515 RepID=UPI000E6E4FDE|nr:protein D3-like [Ctenocephalides felis]XP_026476771.1 protein D3-like [Ctenocephalides felis]
MSPKIKNLEIVPDVLDALPEKALQVSYDSGVSADLGNILTPTSVKNKPTVSWDADPKELYLLCMTDPDAPSRQSPKNREWHHWLVGNIPGSEVSKGEVLTDFVGSGPPKGSGLHRYVFVLYKQPERINFTDKKISSTTGSGRGKFSIRDFAKKYNLGKPLAYNVYQAEWDDYVPKLHKQLTN